MTSQKNKQPGSTLWLKILIVVIFILGTGIRLYDVTDEPLEFHPARQLRSAIIARSIYYKNNPDIPREKILFAVSEANQRGLIEPPIMENLSVIAYRLMGEEEIWVGRLFSIAFWLLGGWALYALSKEFGSLTGSIVSLSLYFLLPFSILATRVLMPDPMMVAFTVISIYCLYTWEKKRTYPWAVLTGLVSGFTIFSKSVAGLILIVPFAVFILKAEGLKSALKNLQAPVCPPHRRVHLLRLRHRRAHGGSIHRAVLPQPVHKPFAVRQLAGEHRRQLLPHRPDPRHGRAGARCR
jgi:4-amino-4-deoxy-L-arabinose transferase-like glycosyltransferase